MRAFSLPRPLVAFAASACSTMAPSSFVSSRISFQGGTSDLVSLANSSSLRRLYPSNAMARETHFELRQQLVRVSPRKLGEVATPREVEIREPDLAFQRLQILDVDPFRVLSDRDLGEFASQLGVDVRGSGRYLGDSHVEPGRDRGTRQLTMTAKRPDPSSERVSEEPTAEAR